MSDGVTTEAGRALREVADDVRASHAPNDWDSCVACQKSWPCDAALRTNRNVAASKLRERLRVLFCRHRSGEEQG